MRVVRPSRIGFVKKSKRTEPTAIILGKDSKFGSWPRSLEQGTEVADALIHYSNGELGGKLERITGHGSTKPNESRYPDQPEKNRRVELSLVLDMSKEDLARYK